MKTPPLEPSPSGCPRAPASTTSTAAATEGPPPGHHQQRRRAPAEHQQLATAIKRVHRRLRSSTARLGAQSAWHQHLQDATGLQRYASAMRTLATRYWDANTASKAGQRTRSSASTEHNRIEWSVRFCREYFGHRSPENGAERKADEEEGKAADNPNDIEGATLLLRQRAREQRIQADTAANRMPEDGDYTATDPLWTPPADGQRLRLLDVGSCYNPFAKYADQFAVTAVDIAPAANSSGVQQCDFLALQVREAEAEEETKPEIAESGPITHLPAAHFDVVVFSLLLEYLPTAEQRMQCVRTAYRLLRPEGCLLIITPDSGHCGRNARLMQTWQWALARGGMQRVRCDKLEHLRCMAFRRAACAAVARRWARLHRRDWMEEAIRIPQDFGGDEDDEGAGADGDEHEVEEEVEVGGSGGDCSERHS